MLRAHSPRVKVDFSNCKFNSIMILLLHERLRFRVAVLQYLLLGTALWPKIPPIATRKPFDLQLLPTVLQATKDRSQCSDTTFNESL